MARRTNPFDILWAVAVWYNQRMSLQNITETIRQKMARAAHIKSRVKFDFGDDGIVFVDNTGDAPVISHDDTDADATLACSIDVFNKIIAGEQDPTMAYMMGRLKIKGSMGLAMKLSSVLED